MTGRSTRQPQRTCVGCRAREDRSRLLRVVATRVGTAVSGAPVAPTTAIVPDPDARLPGRGAWVHRDVSCYDLAVKRRAFVRALRLQGPAEASAVQEHLAPRPPSTITGSGSTSDGHPMSSHR